MALMKKRIIIGSRGSRLALVQSESVKALIEALSPEFSVSITSIVTTGDRKLDQPLAAIGEKALFTQEIEDLLLSGDVDIAVHSLKDLPTDLPADLEISAYSARAESRDCLISRSSAALTALPPGSIVGTSSVRRTSQLLHLRPDLQLKDSRGNIETRLKKLTDGHYDAIVLAAAGLMRLSLDTLITEMIAPDTMLPAAGQGIIAVETKRGRKDLEDIMQSINNAASERMATAERALLQAFGAGCRAPIGALASLDGGRMSLHAYVGSLDGKTAMRDSLSGDVADAARLGRTLAETMLNQGAAEIIARSRHASS